MENKDYYDSPFSEFEDNGNFDDELKHYGVGHLDGGHSGRYPWGSGGVPNQHNSIDFLKRVEKLKEENFTFYDKESGKTYTGDAAIAKSMCDPKNHVYVSTAKFKTMKTIALNNKRQQDYTRAKYLKDQGMGFTEIGRKLNPDNPWPESSVRSLLNPDSKNRMEQAKATAEYLKKEVDKKGMIDVGKGVSKTLNISNEKLQTAIMLLEAEGYNKYNRRIANPTNKEHQTTTTILTTKDKTYKDAYDDSQIQSIGYVISRDNGKTFEPSFVYPASMDSSRLKIRYNEEGGLAKDGLIELRRGVPDLSLGESNYAQVRILVDNKKYIKGMAVYSDGEDMPKGVDVIFNTNKKVGTPKLDVLKDITDDPENPFGSNIKDIASGGQYYYTDKNGKKKLGLINKRSDEGDWSEWSNKVPSQFLSKQPPQLAKKQLNLAVQLKKQEYNEIMSVTNNQVKKFLLDAFAKDCDTEAIHLRAAALPRQQHQVILPLNAIKETEVYAPNYKTGEKVALIRYPHAGTFEIPILTVNNKNKEGQKVLGLDVKDCIAINSKVANQLSGADFDGDTVMVIPTNENIKISASKPLKELENFDPKTEYATEMRINPDSPMREAAIKLRKENYVYEDKKKGITLTGNAAIAKSLGIKTKEVDSLIENGEKEYYNKNGKKVKIMQNKQVEMGKISNLITDMTIKGASTDEIARADKYSMVVIDAEKHKLDYRSCYKENKIDALKRKWQVQEVDENGTTKSGGSSTLISRAKSPYYVDKRQGQARINIKGNKDYDSSRPEGALLYKTADEKKLHYVDKDTGEIVTRKQKSTLMAETDDARTLISDYNTRIENLYANYANSMKTLANTARKSMITTKNSEYNPDAAKEYAKEVESINIKLLESQKNAPREREAMRIANSRIESILESNPELEYDKESLKKRKQQELTRAREVVGAKRTIVDVDDKEWEAIQAGAISSTKLREVLGHTDIDKIREKATPRNNKGLSEYQLNKIDLLLESGNYTNSQIAEMLGVSPSSIKYYIDKK